MSTLTTTGNTEMKSFPGGGCPETVCSVEPSPTQQKRITWALWGLAAVLFCFLQGCPPPAASSCKSDADCKDGQVCRETACVSRPGDGGARERVAVDAGPSEPPPKTDLDLREGSLPGPEGFRDGKPAASKGQRKVGETCNPSLAAGAKDRCEDGALCASPFLSGFGICRKSCSLKNPGCPSGESCAPVPLLENGLEKGYVCAPTVPLFSRCTVGQHCEAGSRCIRYGSDNGGVCQKVCNRSADCPKGQWCGGGFEIGSNQALQVCAYLRAKAGETCGEHRQCGENLNCRGGGADRRCLKSCKATSCPSGFACYKATIGRVEIANCYPVAKVYSPCSSTIACTKGSRCVLFSTALNHRVCLTECTGNEKLCGKDEVCVTSGNRQFCMKGNVAEGQPCGGPLRCAKDLVCTALAAGTSACLRDCSKDSSSCGGGQVCEKVGKEDSSKRCLRSCSADGKCTWPAHLCSSSSGSKVCRFSSKAAAGQVPRNGLCAPYAGAPADKRCGDKLRCVKMVADEWRCLQPCALSGTGACGANEQCLRSRDLNATFCGVVGKGNACDLAQSQFCAPGSRCVLEANTNQGTCQALPAQEKGQSCDPDWLPCKAGLRCAGLPLTPFRWTCTTPCKSRGDSACGSNEVCVITNQGGSCQPTCSDDKDCPQPYQRCLSQGTDKACL